MHCEHLSVASFRNFVRLELDLPTGLTVVLGDNAQGKSNLLEAVYVMATTKSFRASTDRDLIDWRASEDGLPTARVCARVRRDQRVIEMEILVRDDSKAASGATALPTNGTTKRIKLNGITKRALDVIGVVNVVMFSPQDIDLVVGPPMLRRRYLDVTISQVDARYCRALAHYNRVLLQRNHLLRQIRDGEAGVDQLEFWDAELVEVGSYVILRRLEMVDAIDRLARDFHRRLSDHQESLSVSYRGSLEPADNPGDTPRLSETLGSCPDEQSRLAAIQRLYRGQSSQSRTREIAYGATLVGPHRDDLLLSVDGHDVSSLGSRGQQRTVALSLKLAEADFICEETHNYPIILLDDVMSELDRHRRRQVMEMVKQSPQVLVTSTDEYVFDPEVLAQANLLRVSQGAVEPVQKPSDCG